MKWNTAEEANDKSTKVVMEEGLKVKGTTTSKGGRKLSRVTKYFIKKHKGMIVKTRRDEIEHRTNKTYQQQNSK